MKGVAVVILAVLVGDGVVKLRWIGVEKGEMQAGFGLVNMLWIALLLVTEVRMPGCFLDISIFLIGLMQLANVAVFSSSTQGLVEKRLGKVTATSNTSWQSIL